ncbi:MAG: hypothetical protein AAGA68_07325 [Pseudomonadota bacterium]
MICLLLLACEIRQPNRIAQATTYEIARDVNLFNELGYSDPAFAEFLVDVRKPDFKATPVQAMRRRLLEHRNTSRPRVLEWPF